MNNNKLYLIYTGLEFNKFYNNGYIFVTLADKKLKTGLNINKITYDSKTNSYIGGIDFINLQNIDRWINFKNKKIYCRIVSVPNDNYVYVFNGKYKASHINLSNKILLDDLECWNNPEFCKRMVEKNYNFLTKG